jgi:hypothetical protein
MSNVSHPAHYNQGKIEVIEFIEDKSLGFHRGNAVKYIARAGVKDPAKEIEDLEKAVWYLNREIENVRAKKEGRDPKRPNDMVARASLNSYDAPPTPSTYKPICPECKVPLVGSPPFCNVASCSRWGNEK